MKCLHWGIGCAGTEWVLWEKACIPKMWCPCHSGWLPYWTPSERAGLKALGERMGGFNNLYGFDYLKMRHSFEAAEEMIRVFVKAARKVKDLVRLRRAISNYEEG